VKLCIWKSKTFFIRLILYGCCWWRQALCRRWSGSFRAKTGRSSSSNALLCATGAVRTGGGGEYVLVSLSGL
jgi:hypothetical protein